MLNEKFAHLHIHDEYSLLDGCGSCDGYIEKALEMGFKYLAITNHGNVDGLIRFQKVCKDKEIKPIFGCELYIVPNALSKEKGEKRGHIVVLVKNKKGWQNLLKMLTFANVEGFYKRPRVDYDFFLKHCEGLIILTGCVGSFLTLEGGERFLIDLIAEQRENIYIEIMPHNDPDDLQIKHNKLCKDLAKAYSLPLVATNDAHYIAEKDRKSQEVLLAIQTKKKWTDSDRFKFSFTELYLRDANGMIEGFLKQGIFDKSAVMNAMRNTIKIAEECANFSIEKLDVYLPQIPQCKGMTKDQEIEFLKDLCEKGLKTKMPPGDEEAHEVKVYMDRYTEEINLIVELGFERYFLIVWELINWCKDNDIMCGPGRGCFLPDIRITKRTGYKRIQDIKEGEYVFTHDRTYQKVVKKFEYPIDEEIIVISLSNSKTIKCTKDHKIMTCNGYLEADKLNIGNKVLSPIRNLRTRRIFHKCEICGKERSIALNKYIEGINKICLSCASKKADKTKGGNYWKSDEARERMRNIICDYYKDEKNLSVKRKQNEKMWEEKGDIIRNKLKIINSINHSNPQLVEKMSSKKYYFYSERQMKEIICHSNLELKFLNIAENRTDIKYFNRCKFFVNWNYNKRYYPDFYLIYSDGRKEFVEIKSEYWWNRNFDSNIKKKKAIEDFIEKNCPKNVSYKIIFEDDIIKMNDLVHDEITITGIGYEHYEGKVYDIKVDKVYNYVAEGITVHNSVGGCLVAYLLGITKVDPIEHKLLFSRFISPARIDLPDIDMDFEDIKRKEIRRHLEQVYGKNCVAGASTFSKMKGRGVLRDVARVFDVPISDVDPAAKSIITRSGGDFRASFSITDAFETFEDGIKFKKKYPEVTKIAINLEGQTRNCLSGENRLMLPDGKGGQKTKKIKHLFGMKYRGPVRMYNHDKDLLCFANMKDIYCNGIKDVYRLSAKGSNSIILTLDHKLLTKEGYKEAKDIQIGDLIAVNGFKKGNIPWNKGKKNSQIPWNKGLKGAQEAWNKGLTKYDHPSIMESSKRMFRNNPLNDERVRKIISEKNTKHGLFSVPIKYKKRNPICELCGDKTEEVHHLDKDKLNNEENNLLAVCCNCHNLLHHKDRIKNKNINKINPLMTIKWRKVISIEYWGKEKVYDIEIDSKHHNFVCNRIISHNCGIHAAALIVSKDDLTKGQRTYLKVDKKNGGFVVNWDKKDVEHVGLMKLDVLGLNALTIMNETQKMVLENKNISIDFESIPINIKSVFDEFTKGNCIGIFQFGSLGLRKLCADLKINTFRDLVDANALFRPGTLRSGMTNVYVARKNGEEEWDYDHPYLEELTKDTYGIILYQEQIMKLMYELAGMGWRTADTVRKVIGKSQGVDQFLKFKDDFIKGCKDKNTLDEKSAGKLWDTLSSHGSYSFNLSHAVEYSMISYWEMWLKTKFPAEFIACSLSYGQDDKKPELVEEAKRIGLKIQLPKIGRSDSKVWKVKGDTLYVPFLEMKGIGTKTAEKIHQLDKIGFYEGEKEVKINKNIRELLDNIKAFDLDYELSEEEKEKFRDLFGFEISEDPMRKYKGIKALLENSTKINQLKDIDFKVINKKKRYYFGQMVEIRFGYSHKMKEIMAKESDISKVEENLGGVYGNIKDETDYQMVVFSSKIYNEKKYIIEHCGGEWALLECNVPSKSNNLICHNAWIGEELLKGNLNGLNIDLGEIKRFRGEDISKCRACDLRKTAKFPVPHSMGRYNAVIVGEAPGFDENLAGKGFVGKAGDVLWKKLKRYGLERWMFHVTNVCKCWPGRGNATPSISSVKICGQWLEKEIKGLKPFVILALGNTSLQFFKGEKTGITAMSGVTEWDDKRNCFICYCVHPAMLLHGQEEAKELFNKGIKNFYEKIRILGGNIIEE